MHSKEGEEEEGEQTALSCVRSSTARVLAQSQHVHIDEPSLHALASTMASQLAAQPSIEWDSEGWHYTADAGHDAGPLTCQYILVLDSLNFCFHPTPGLEYDHLARGLKSALERDPTALDAKSLAIVTSATVNGWLAEPQPGVAATKEEAAWGFPQLDERVRKVREVGQVLLRHFNGLAANVVKQAKHSAEDLVRLVIAFFPGFRDECVYKGTQVFFYKRAQILVGDIWAAYGKHTTTTHPFGFTDMHRLTMFADYRIPQILRGRGVLEYASDLAKRVDRMEYLPAGSEEEVEIRAATVQAVEQLRKVLEEKHGLEREAVKSVLLDWVLWQEGEKLKDTLPPHHRTLTVWY